jgi:hypothetical protein
MRLRSDRERKAASFDWTLWLKWILASTLGWAIGLVLRVEFAIGVAVGILQWLVLRPLVRGAGWWIPASAGGWGVGAALVTLVLRPENPFIAPVIIGVGIGVAQWLVLRWQFQRAWWWIVLSTLGWAVGMMGVFGASLAGAAAGAVTGVALELLLRHPRPVGQNHDPGPSPGTGGGT